MAWGSEREKAGRAEGFYPLGYHSVQKTSRFGHVSTFSRNVAWHLWDYQALYPRLRSQRESQILQEKVDAHQLSVWQFRFPRRWFFQIIVFL
jgi:hypothetical protein